MFSVITNIYNKKTKGPTLMQLFDPPPCQGYNIYTYTGYAAVSPKHIIKYLSF